MNQACLNCGQPLSGHFCSQCGQRDVPPYPTLRELASEAIAEFSGWDGRFLITLRTLITKPGLLTLEFLQGKRARYLSPIRVYLFASVAYFVVSAAAPEVLLPGQKPRKVSVQISGDTTNMSRPERVAAAAKSALEDPEHLSQAERDSALKDLERAPLLMRPVLRMLVGDPDGFKRKIAETLPKMLFVLLPLFALILSLFYRGRRYPEHLYFAVHLHSYVFFALTVIALAKFGRSPMLLAPIAILGMLSIPVYSTRALRRVYDGSVVGTLGKEIGIGVLYLFCVVFAFYGLLLWISVI